MPHNDDILAAFDIAVEQQEDCIQDLKEEADTSVISSSEDIDFSIIHIENDEDIENTSPLEEKTKSSQIKSSLVFIVKYLSTSLCIFGVLLGIANYSAYSNLVYSFIYAEEMQETEKSIINSVAAGEIIGWEDEEEVNTFKQLDNEAEIKEEKTEYAPSMHSLWKLIAKAEKDTIDLWIEITPYENRIIIPKIGKNIPLLDIKEKKVEWIAELNDIFMKELENGVIRYPGSAKPGDNGNSFIFGHSSNLPWLEGDYNDVFALLDNVKDGDEVIVYYGQEKHTYIMRTRDVIRPGDVSVLKNNINDRSQLTLMTCWPIGTTINRLVLTGELISIE